MDKRAAGTADPGIRENSTVGIAEGGRNDEGLESEAVAGRDGAVTRGKGANGETERRARGDGIGGRGGGAADRVRPGRRGCRKGEQRARGDGIGGRGGAGVEILGGNTAEWGKGL